MSLVHIFEAAGLGVAPFRLEGVTEAARGSSCDFCGTAIRLQFWISSATPRPTFKVGCDCVRKTGDAGLIDTVEEARKALARAKRATKRAAAHLEEARAAQAARRAVARTNALAFKAYVSGTVGLRGVLVRATHRTDTQRKIAVEFVRRMAAGGELTHKQHQYLLNLGREYTTEHLTMGKGQIVVGRVVGAWVDDFGTPKLLVETNGGEKVGVTNNHPTIYNPEMKGQVITFTAELQRKYEKIYALRPKGMKIVA